MTMPIHAMLADRDLLPAEHLIDAGYPVSTATNRDAEDPRQLGLRGDGA